MSSKPCGMQAALWIAVLCLVPLCVTSAWSQSNLFTNPGFETGGFNGWSVNPNSQNYGVNVAGFRITGTDPAFGPTYEVVHSGTYAGYATVCTTCSSPQYIELTQAVTLVPGNIYTLSFWLGNGSSLSYYDASYVLLNGTNLPLTILSPVLPGYTVNSASFIATQTNATFTFHIQGSGGGIAGFSFDDLSIAQTGGPATNGGYLYETSSANIILAYQINTNTGMLVRGSGPILPTGPQPIAVATTSLLTYVADQGSAQISAYSTNQTTGVMTQLAGSPYSAHMTPVAIAIDRPLHFVYAVGGQSSHGAIGGWSYNTLTGALTPIPGSPFTSDAAISAIAFSRNGQNAYVVNHFNNVVLAYSVNPTTGALTELSGSPYPAGIYPLAIATDTVGNFLYVANAGDNTISAFQIGSNGTLTPVPGSPFANPTGPWWFAFDSSQRYLYVSNHRANSISAYAINPATGALTQVNGSPFAAPLVPTSITSSHNFLYVDASPNILTYRINPLTGALTMLTGLPPVSSGSAIATASGGGAN